MMDDVVISLHSVHDSGSDDEDCLDFSTDGLYTFEDGVGCLTYMETEVTGLEGTRTTVMVMPQQVVVDRDGLITSRMIFREGEKNSMLYDTPYGNATMSISTRRITHAFDENGGRLEVDFVLDVEHAVVSRNLVQLSVEKIKQGVKPNV